jgi:hypothetical protein
MMTELTPNQLNDIVARYQLARMAGEDAEDAGRGWDHAKINAIVRSWQDVYVLFQEVRRCYDEHSPRRAA